MSVSASKDSPEQAEFRQYCRQWLADNRPPEPPVRLPLSALEIMTREQLDYLQAWQKSAYDAGLVFVWTAIFERCKWKYKQRAYRYTYLDAGHIAQSVALASVALGLGSCQIGAIYDEEANALLGVDEVEESTIYMTTVGVPNP